MGDLKTLFEGKGGKCKNLHEKLDIHFEGACFLVASNGLPTVSDPYHKDYKNDWEPLMSRMRIVKLTEKHEGDDRPDFPYNAVILAHAMRQLAEEKVVVNIRLADNVSASQPSSSPVKEHQVGDKRPRAADGVIRTANIVVQQMDKHRCFGSVHNGH
jgi:hypothetical protein